MINNVVIAVRKKVSSRLKLPMSTSYKNHTKMDHGWSACNPRIRLASSEVQLRTKFQILNDEAATQIKRAVNYRGP